MAGCHSREDGSRTIRAPGRFEGVAARGQRGPPLTFGVVVRRTASWTGSKDGAWPEKGDTPSGGFDVLFGCLFFKPTGER
jgi:hypothetical protein